MIEFNFVPQEDIRKWWSTIKVGLDEIREKNPGDWIVEDVYVDLVHQKSMLWVVIENNRFVGFLVLQQIGQEIDVWAAWTLENDYQVVEKGLQLIKNVAKKLNAKYLTFCSMRQGWQRKASSYGFRPNKWICEV
jgi:hypothetical protein